MYIENNGFNPFMGYGRFATEIVKHMEDKVIPIHSQQLQAGKYIKELQFVDDDLPVLSVLAPSYLRPISNKQRYLYTMTEGNDIPPVWKEIIDKCGISKIFVPSQYCYDSFSKLGYPTIIIPGGTNPNDFPVIEKDPIDTRPYTFLCFADRGYRKGWMEVWEAFHNVFKLGDKVRLIVKYNASGDTLMLDKLNKATINHPQIKFDGTHYDNTYELYKQIDCLVMPSHAEGWGMIPREVAMSGIPAIVLKYSAFDEQYLERWAFPLHKYVLKDVPADDENLAGQNATPDIEEIGKVMLDLFNGRDEAKNWAVNQAARWLRKNQTWEQTVKLIEGNL